jgi:hypothetical protein
MCLEQIGIYSYCGHRETTIYECDKHLNDSIQEGVTGYSLCSKYKKEEIKTDKECRDCFVADKARKEIRKLGRVLEGLIQKAL